MPRFSWKTGSIQTEGDRTRAGYDDIMVRKMVERGLKEIQGPPKRLLELARSSGVEDGDWVEDGLDETIYRPED